MSVTRVIRFILGVICGALFLGFVLPFVGIPSSHFLPPSHVWQKAQKVTWGRLTSKYYDVTQDPFHVGDLQYFVNYQYYAPAPLSSGVAKVGKPQLYNGTVRLKDKGTYNYIATPPGVKADDVKAKVIIPVLPLPIHVRYEKTYPDISGIDEPWGGRNIGQGSNTLSGWLLWVLAAFAVGYLFMLLFERFGAKENL